MKTPPEVPEKVRALFLSDLHLGYRLSRAERSLPLLRDMDTEQLYLVGDLIDTARMARQWYWPAGHQQVVDTICEIARSKTEVYIVPGNHDPCFRNQDYFEMLTSRFTSRIQEIVAPLQDFTIRESFVYNTLAKKKLLVTHGDLYDNVETRFAGIPRLGSRIFDRINWIFPVRLTHLLRSFFKLILARPGRIESTVVEDTRRQKLDGLIFAHLHAPDLKYRNGLIVANTGDWMENESFLIETTDGRWQLFNRGRLVQELE